MTVRKAVVFILVLLIIIILVGLGIFLIDSKTKNTDNTNTIANKTLPGSVPEYNNYVDVSQVGHIGDIDDKTGFFLTVNVKNVLKQGDLVFLEIETFNSKKEKVTKKLLVFDNNIARKDFYIEKTNNLADVSNTKRVKITTLDDIYNKLSSYKNNTILAFIDLSPVLTQTSVFDPYKTNIKCNDNFHSYLKGGTSQNSCDGETQIIYVKD